MDKAFVNARAESIRHSVFVSTAVYFTGFIANFVGILYLPRYSNKFPTSVNRISK